MTAPRPWAIGKRYGNWGTEVVDARGDVVCIVFTHQRVKRDNEPAEWRATDRGADLLAVLTENLNPQARLL